MIFITGDTHANFERFNRVIFPEQKSLTKDDYVIICGDFGGLWYQEETKEEKHWLDWLDQKNFTTLYIDGNHENYDRYKDIPIEEWHGGKIQRIRESVIHLMRGQIYEICGKSFFTFGGAKCHDIPDGIFEADDPRLKHKKRMSHLWYRVNHISWWKEELPSEEEMEEGIQNLEKANWKTDFILTHCAPSSIQHELNLETYETDYLTDYLEEIHRKCSYNYWFCGHYHMNLNVNSRDKIIYEQIIRIV